MAVCLKRFWILFKTEFNAWRYDPITALGGVIPPTFILLAFWLLFGGRLLFHIAVVNHDSGPYGGILIETIDETLSPFGIPYYGVVDASEEEAWREYDNYQIEGVWVIPADFSERVEAGDNPRVEMYFNNYIDDRGKNHRIYSAEIMWAFYKKIGLPGPPLEIAEDYPRDEMIHWFPVIAVGVTLMAAMLGGIFNMYVLTHKEAISGLTLEYALMSRPVLWVLLPKTLLALIFSLATGTLFLVVLYLWLGIWAGAYLWLVWGLFGLVALFWIGIALVVGLRARNYMAGAIGVALSGIIVFFIGGGMGLVRINRGKVLLISWLFPNTYAVDPLRDMLLFNAMPVDLQSTLIYTTGLAAISLLLSWAFSTRQIRRLG